MEIACKIFLVLFLFCHVVGLKSNELHYMDFENILTGEETLSLLSLISFADNTSEQCRNALKQFSEDFQDHKEWALKMVDSAGKTHSGVLEGAFTWLGSYQECLGIHTRFNETGPDVSGRYCLLYPNLFNVTTSSNFTKQVIRQLGELNKDMMNLLSWRIGLCVPNVCSSKDIASAIKQSINNSFAVKTVCNTRKNTFELSTGFIIIMCVCAFFMLMAIIGTYIDKCSTADIRHSKSIKLLMAFSVPFNAKKILDVDSKPAESLDSLHGLRFFSICWVVLGHTYGFVPLQTYDDALKVKSQTFLNPLFDPVLGGEFSVDTFFLISGLLVTYIFLREKSKPNSSVNLAMFYFHRWWRLTPVYMVILGITTVFAPLLMSGPLAQESLHNLGDCPANWWSNILYINNFYIKDMCMSHSWYLACDMQMYLMAPLILYPLAKWPKYGLLINAVFLLSSIVTPTVITVVYDYPPMATIGTDAKTYGFFQQIYIKPYCRMVPYCIGIYVGYLLFTRKRQITIHKLVKIIGWTLSTATAIGLLYGMSLVYKGGHVPVVFAGLYAAFNKLIWSLIVGWIIINTTTNNACWIDSILSFKYLTPGSRLTYCLYLIHPAIMYINASRIDHISSFSHFRAVQSFIAFLVIGLAAALVLSVLFESPFVNLEKVLFRTTRLRNNKDPTVESVTESTLVENAKQS